MKTAVVITTLNEAGTIGPLVRALHPRKRVFVVDGGSTDDTRKEARMAGAILCDLPAGPEIGPCLLHGWWNAINMGYDRIAQLDAGGSHDPADLERLLKVQADIVIGSRFSSSSHYKGRPLRALLSRAAALGCNAVTGLRLTDWTSGYRVFTAEAAQALLAFDYRAKMHGWQVEVLMNAHRAGLSIAEAPITYTAGRSSFSRSAAWEAFDVWRRFLTGGHNNANRAW